MNEFNSLVPIITTHAKDYTHSIKRPIPSTGIPNASQLKLQGPKDIEFLYQRKIVTLLESGVEKFEAEGLKILTLLSYSDDIEFELKPKAKLLSCLLLLLQATSVIPLPPSYSIYIAAPSFRQDNDLLQYNPRHLANIAKRKQILKIIYNLSFESKNKPIIANEKNLIYKLIDFGAENEIHKSDYIFDLIGIFSNIAKYAQFPFDYPNFKLFLNQIIDLIIEENWNLTRLILSLFQKLSQRTENEHIFLALGSFFYNSIIGVLCLPQSYLNSFPDMKEMEEQMEIYRTLQEKALAIIHNLSTYQGAISHRSCQQVGCVEVLITLLDIPDFPDISRRSAITLLNFSSEKQNHEYILPFVEKLLLLAWNSENHSSSILLKLISKLTESSPEFSPFDSPSPINNNSNNIHSNLPVHASSMDVEYTNNSNININSGSNNM